MKVYRKSAWGLSLTGCNVGQDGPERSQCPRVKGSEARHLNSGWETWPEPRHYQETRWQERTDMAQIVLESLYFSYINSVFKHPRCMLSLFLIARLNCTFDFRISPPAAYTDKFVYRLEFISKKIPQREDCCCDKAWSQLAVKDSLSTQ